MPSAPHRSVPLRLLLVDTGSSITELRRALADVASVESVPSIGSALSAIVEWAPDCVIVDLTGEENDGLDAVAAITARHREIPIVAIVPGDDAVGLAAVGGGAQDAVAISDLVEGALLGRIAMAIERKKVEWSFFRADERHRRALDVAPVGVWRGDADGTTTYANNRLITMLGGEAWVSGNLLERIEPADRDAVQALLSEVAQSDTTTALIGSLDVTTALIRDDGSRLDVVITFNPADPSAPVGTVLAFVSEHQDSTTSPASVAVTTSLPQYQDAQVDFSPVVANVSDVISIHDADGNVRWTNERASDYTNNRQGPLSTYMTHVHAEDRDAIANALQSWLLGGTDSVSYRVTDLEGNVRYLESVGANLLDNPQVAGLVVTTRDVTERRESQRELARAALHDPLTDLANRTLLLDRLTHALATRAANSTTALIFLDIDHFKVINDSLGHETGDAVIATIADVLRATTRPTDTIARTGGDNFALCVRDLRSVDEALATAQRVSEDIAAISEVEGHQVHLSISVGVVIADELSDAEQMLSDAEVAMYRAKDRGRSRVELFDEEARARIVGRLTLQHELRDALRNNEFRLFFQPQVRLDSAEIVSFEALLRWEHPARGLLSPAAFIDVAEESRLIEPIGRWVLEESCRRAAEWRQQFPEKRLSVAVNLSAQQLVDAELPELVGAAIDAAGIDPTTVCLELTESMLMEDAEGAITILRRLKERGVRLAIDDFGTGYSSLAYLKRFPIDQLKVDRSFVAGLGRDPEDFVIVSAVVNLAKSLGVEVVAEGVENERHVAELEAIGCPLAQGYLWSPPVPANTVAALLERASVATTTRPVAPADRAVERTSQAIDVVSLLTHELRAPLTVIKGYAETMVSHLDDGVSPMVTKASAAIARNVTQLDELIATLTDVNALETGSLPLDRRAVDVIALVQGVVKDHGHLFPDRPVHVDVRADDLSVLVDAPRIQQILLNLLSNAAKFSPPQSAIDVTVLPHGNDVQISVVDCGPGVPPELAGEIFRKFFRVDNTKKGTGLGLYVARSLARAHGGDISCRTAVSGGAEFVLTLPRARRRERPSSRNDVVDMRGPAPTEAVEERISSSASVALEEARVALLAAETAEQVVGAVIALLRSLGGGTIPARVADEAALPIEVSCGHGEALFATAAPASPERAVIDRVLPDFIDEARNRVRELRHSADDADVDGGRVDVVTGLAGGRLVARAIGKLRSGSTVVLLRVDSDKAEHLDGLLQSVARVLRELHPSGTSIGRFGADQIAFLLPGQPPEVAVAALEDVRRAWEIRRPRPVAIAAGVAAVGPAGAQAALLAADEACRRSDFVNSQQ